MLFHHDTSRSEEAVLYPLRCVMTASSERVVACRRPVCLRMVRIPWAGARDAPNAVCPGQHQHHTTSRTPSRAYSRDTGPRRKPGQPSGPLEAAIPQGACGPNAVEQCRNRQGGSWSRCSRSASRWPLNGTRVGDHERRRAPSSGQVLPAPRTGSLAHAGARSSPSVLTLRFLLLLT
ncbi:hypothetical protein C8Q77DRAFT_524882 [Trametes polyzona]|nr:hypothetical protein C8Q77DRAFT_524882 [Trametes polyzona]